MTIPSLLSTIITKTSDASPYLRFANADGKAWLMPQRRMQVAMMLYQPSSRKGRWLKRLLPYLHTLSVVRKAIGAEQVCLRLTPDFETVLHEVFGSAPLDVAFFCGTPCVHQKITVQISRGEQLLGYAKVSDNPEVIALFEKEANTLRYLHEQGITNVPQALYCDKLTEGVGVFVQSTEKTLHSTTQHTWGAMHSEFLKNLHYRTTQEIAFEATDYAQDLHYLSTHLHLLPSHYEATLKEAITTSMRSWKPLHYTHFSAFHGDLTPWNTYMQHEALHVFDWEYAKRTYPEHLDFWHFYTQVGIFEHQADAHTLIKGLHHAARASKLFHLYDMEDGNPSISHYQEAYAERRYLAYLLAIISHYTRREQGQFDAGIARSIDTYIAIITHLLTPKHV